MLFLFFFFLFVFFFFQAEDGIRDIGVTGVQTCCSSDLKYLYHGNFLVSSNIRYDCVLGWDFLAANRLELIVKNVAGDRKSVV